MTAMKKLLVVTAVCGATMVQTWAQIGKSITSELVRPTVEKLSNDDLGGRGAGYGGEKRAADLIAREFKRLGLQPMGDRSGRKRTYFQEFTFLPRHPVTPWESLKSRNVLGLIPGSEPGLREEVVVLGAHYDGQGQIGEADPMRIHPKGMENDRIWNSANDNAASVAAILAIARAMKSERIRPKRSILLAAFGAEEHGMAGSLYYVMHPPSELAGHVAMINLEKLGRAPDRPLVAGATGTSSSWGELIQRISSGTNSVKPLPFIVPDSDHYAFAMSGIPAVTFFVSARDDSHQPTDTADKLDYARVAAYARLALEITLAVADSATRMPYTDIRGRDPGLVVHLVSASEADAAGLRDPRSGLKVTGVIPGGPADRAGLKVGDLIVESAGTLFDRNMTLETLQKMQMELLMGKQEQIPMTVQRQGATLSLSLGLPAPKGP